jgi:hypothetical protein
MQILPPERPHLKRASRRNLFFGRIRSWMSRIRQEEHEGPMPLAKHLQILDDGVAILRTSHRALAGDGL